MAQRIVVGMSGGVDSSVAALVLQDQGWDVVGVTLHLWDYGKEGHAGRCCAPEDQYDASRVCAAAGIPHYTFDRRELFRERVVDRFVDDYASGRTPSPCVRCNESVKLGPLRDIARRLGADRIATGHYARIAPCRVPGDLPGDGGVDLRAATETARDQSYFLWAAPLAALRDLVLPLGTWTKADVRAYAARRGLATAAKPDSTDLCFVEGGAYADFVAAHARALGPPGAIETTDGRVVGSHAGVHGFTVGQRRGLGAGGAPRYVLKIVADRAAVVVGDAAEAAVTTVRVEHARWLVPHPPERTTVRVRYRHPGALARVVGRAGSTLDLEFAEGQRGVAPGQAAVMYDGDRVVGGGWIA